MSAIKGVDCISLGLNGHMLVKCYNVIHNGVIYHARTSLLSVLHELQVLMLLRMNA